MATNVETLPAIALPSGLSRDGRASLEAMGIEERTSVQEFLSGNFLQTGSGFDDRWDINTNFVSEYQLWGIPPVHKAVSYIANVISGLPVEVAPIEEGVAGDATMLAALEAIMDEPNDRMDFGTLIWLVAKDLCLYGEAFMEVEYLRNGLPAGLWYLPAASTYRLIGVSLDAYQTYIPLEREYKTLPPERVVHILSKTRDGLRGVNLVDSAREFWRTELNMRRYAGRIFRAGIPFGVLAPTTEAQITKEQAKTNLKNWVDQQRSSAGVAFLSNAMAYTRVTVSPDEAQFLETRLHNVREVAMLFGVPPQIAGDYETSTQNATLETIYRQVAEDAIAPRLRAMQRALRRRLGLRAYGLEITWDYSSLTRGDPAERASYLQVALGGKAWLTVDEARRMEGLPELTPQQLEELNPPAPEMEPGDEGEDDDATEA